MVHGDASVAYSGRRAFRLGRRWRDLTSKRARDVTQDSMA